MIIGIPGRRQDLREVGDVGLRAVVDGVGGGLPVHLLGVGGVQVLGEVGGVELGLEVLPRSARARSASRPP
jgi:hypothetical protein